MQIIDGRSPNQSHMGKIWVFTIIIQKNTHNFIEGSLYPKTLESVQNKGVATNWRVYYRQTSDIKRHYVTQIINSKMTYLGKPLSMYV